MSFKHIFQDTNHIVLCIIRRSKINSSEFQLLQTDLKTDSLLAGSEVLTAVVVRSFIVWDIMLCNQLKVSQNFRVTSHKQGSACYLFQAGFLLSLFFNPEDGGNMFF
jgi:hypothetical protein